MSVRAVILLVVVLWGVGVYANPFGNGKVVKEGELRIER